MRSGAAMDQRRRFFLVRKERKNKLLALAGVSLCLLGFVILFVQLFVELWHCGWKTFFLPITKHFEVPTPLR